MAAYRTDENETERIEELAEEAEFSLAEVNLKKDLKERRKIMKLTFYDGSHKLRHIIPKGKHL
jgi:hypothetical protein